MCAVALSVGSHGHDAFNGVCFAPRRASRREFPPPISTGAGEKTYYRRGLCAHRKDRGKGGLRASGRGGDLQLLMLRSYQCNRACNSL
jgi:hypothetical protein